MGKDPLSSRVSLFFVSANVCMGFNSALPEWEKRCVPVLRSVMRDNVNRIPERPAVVHEPSFVFWVRLTDYGSGNNRIERSDSLDQTSLC